MTLDADARKNAGDLRPYRSPRPACTVSEAGEKKVERGVTDTLG